MSLRKPPKFTTGRIVLTALFFFIQLIWGFALFFRFLEYSIWLQAILRVASLFMILYLLNQEDNPTYRMSWILLIALFPMFGTLVYLTMGNSRLTRKMSKQLSEEIAAHAGEMDDVPSAVNLLSEYDPRLGGLAKYVEDYAHMPVHLTPNVTYYPTGEDCFEHLLDALRSAEEFIFIEFFIVDTGYMLDSVLDILEEKVKEGVQVRFIYDFFGCITRLPNNFAQLLEERGIRAFDFNPFTPIFSLSMNTRDHRKIVVVDGKVGFSGGINLADEYINKIERFGHWKDTVVRIEGPAVWNMTTMFLTMWNAFYPLDDDYHPFNPYSFEEEAKKISQGDEALLNEGLSQPLSDSPLDDEPMGENIYIEILSMATDYVYMYTPYLVLSNKLEEALKSAAKRGVDVRLMTPGIPDKKMIYRLTRAHYPALIKAGVKIFEYSPGFLHAKTFVSDDKVGTVGSMNMDYRSLYLNFESNVILYCHPELKRIKEDFLRTQSQSKQVFLSDTRLGYLGQLWNSVLGLIAPFV